MEGESESSLWQRIAKLFHVRNNDSVEQAIMEASEEGELQAEEGSMLLRVLHLSDLQVQDIMTPRTDIICTSTNAAVADVIELILASGHSRIPIYRDTRDNIVGVIYAKDLLRHTMTMAMTTAMTKPMVEGTIPDLAQLPVSELSHPPFFIPESKKVLDLLHDFKSNRKHLAVILDEYGGTAGIVSIEDVLEQIVGDIEDEHDTPREEDITILEDGRILLSGRAYLEDVAEQTPIDLDSDDVDTIGGFLCHLAGRVPLPGEHFIAAQTRFTVMEADATQIRLIKAEPLKAVETPENMTVTDKLH